MGRPEMLKKELYEMDLNDALNYIMENIDKVVAREFLLDKGIDYKEIKGLTLMVSDEGGIELEVGYITLEDDEEVSYRVISVDTLANLFELPIDGYTADFYSDKLYLYRLI